MRGPTAGPDATLDHAGTDLILRDLASGTSLVLGNVDEFAFNEAGTRLAYTVHSERATGNGLYVLDPGNRPSADPPPDARDLRPADLGPGGYGRRRAGRQRARWDDRAGELARGGP